MSRTITCFFTVKERIREIGVMKSLGATTGIIRRQYILEVLEAALLGIVSSLIGIILGSLIVQSHSVVGQPAVGPYTSGHCY